MKKNNLNYLVIFLAITFVVSNIILMEKVFAIEENEINKVNSFNCSLKINSKNNTLFDNDNNTNYLLDYNTIMLDMDVVFPAISKAYNISNDENYNSLLEEFNKLFYYQKSTNISTKKHTAYRKYSLADTKINLDKNNLLLSIPDIYMYVATNTSTIDDSLLIELEKRTISGVDHYYIPIYLLTNIPGITISIDGKEVYNKSNYIDSISALSETNNHQIVINVEKISDYSSLNVSVDENTYYGEEDGSLWREEAKKRIEKYRKSNVKIILTDKNGKKIDNTSINIDMISNNFKFGTEIGYVGLQNEFDDSINSKYFNVVGSDNLFKYNLYHTWDGDISELENLRRNLLNEATNVGITNFRGHCLFWDMVQGAGNKRISGFREIIGKQTDFDENNITMAFVYNKYQEYNSDNNYTPDEKNQIDVWIMELKKKFENQVLDYIKTMVNEYPEIKEWDLFNELRTSEYFKYYLYEENFLISNNFLTDKSYNPSIDDFTINDEYIDFLIKCIDVFRENTDAELVLNENYITAMRVDELDSINYQELEILKVLNSKRSDKIDALGIQNHVKGRAYFTPTSYNNSINRSLDETGIKKAKITEYDNFIGTYARESADTDSDTISDLKKQQRANYMKDSLIAAYSNPNINEFTLYGFNWKSLDSNGVLQERFTELERDAYRNTVEEWLNYSSTVNISNDGIYNTRLYKGTYIASVVIDNKTYTKKFNIADSQDEIILDFNIDYGDINDKDETVVNVDNTLKLVSKFVFIISIVLIISGIAVVLYSYLKLKNNNK